MSTPPAMLHPELLARDDTHAIYRDGHRLDHAEGASKPVRSQRLRACFSVIEASAVAYDRVGIVFVPELRMEHRRLGRRRCGAHALAPFRTWAIWMNLIGTPMRSAQPC